MNELQKRFLAREGYCRIGVSENLFLIKMLRQKECYFILFPLDKTGIKRSQVYGSISEAMASYKAKPIIWDENNETS